ncbi:MAG TPA: cation transporter [Elusimicrobia bacterium]|nr:cation transporter [Elusimicrobiota bacterium]HBT61996.1 cation transporter [Elusimicrobiota bacterium]
MTSVSSAQANREKFSVALTSVCAAVALTGTKLAVGLWTNSLGILSEAAHSGLDLLAAGMTLWAVSVAGKPADSGHTYGHGKVENLSALFETLLLLLTCVWIIWEAAARLFLRQAHVDVNAYSFIVVLFSIAIDYSRSRALKRVADKYQSQALEADALHFSTDIWSSCVVLFGLCGVLAAKKLELPWLERADSVAALGVALIVIWVCCKLGRKSIDDLLDAAPKDLQKKVASAALIQGVREVRHVRVRRSGPAVFADVAIAVGHETTLERAHEIADQAEISVRASLPGADVVVHVEPCVDKDDPLTKARVLAARHGLGAHGLRICDESSRLCLELHLEVDPELSIEAAHSLVSLFETDLRAWAPEIDDVVTHIEPAGEHPQEARADPDGERRLRAALDEFLAAEKQPARPHEIKVRSSGGELTLTLHCFLPPETGVREAHDLTVRLEKHLHAAVKDLGRIVIHVEPMEGARR